MLKKNVFSILVALIILYLSLSNPHTFDKVPIIKIPHFDKIVHFLMYFDLMSVIIFENRKLINNVRQLLLISLIPLFYGILMEVLQSVLTTSRTGDIFDVLFNTIGIFTSLLLSIWINPFMKGTIK
jgi:VanZ family protein